MNVDRSILDLHSVSNGISIPRNNRDASNSRASGSGSATGAWSRPAPTPIAVPSNRPPRLAPSSKSTHNPYSSRMRDTLTEKPNKKSQGTGNVTASRTILDSTLQNPRPRHSNDPPVRLPYLRKNPDAFRKAKDRPVSVSSDEDTGEIVERNRTTSPDPIDSISDGDTAPTRFKPRASSSSSRTPLTFQPEPRAKRMPPADGESTKRLASRIRPDPAEIINIDDDDSAEPALPAAPVPEEDDLSELTSIGTTDSPTHSRPSSSSMNTRHTSPTLGKIPRNTVSERVAQIEKSGGDGVVSTPAIPNTTHSRVPLGQMSKSKELTFNAPSGGVKDRMKSKAGSSTGDWASQPTGFTSLKPVKSKANQVSSRVELPLEAWFHGIYAHDFSADTTTHWLSCDGKNIRIKRNSSAKRDIVTINIRDNIGSATVTEPRHAVNTLAVIVLLTGGAPKKDSKLDYAKTFRYGAHGPKGMIRLLFEQNHPNWEQGGPYRTLVEILRKELDTVRFVNGERAKEAWEAGYSPETDEERPKPKRRHTSETDSINRDDESGKMSLTRSLSRTSLADDDPPGPPPRRIPRRTTVTIAQGELPSRLTRSTRRGQDELTRKSPVVDPDELILVYPPSGQGAVNITRGDIKRLEPGQYLNDTLIEFALKLWLNTFRDDHPELAEQVHVFNSFFYKKIAVKDKKEGYKSVRKWTSKFDLFKKKYLIVPINEHLHWYLAIICNPEYVLQPPPPTPPKAVSSVQTRKRKRESDVVPEINGDPVSEVPSRTDTREPTPLLPRSGSEVDETSVEALIDEGNSSLEQADQAAAPTTASIPDNDVGGLTYPSSEPDPMEVDAPPDAAAAETSKADGATEAANSSQTLEDSDVVVLDDAPMEVETTAAAAASSSAVIPASRFYGSAGKGKARALSPEVPFPDTTAPSTETQEAADPEPSESDPNKTWIFTFDSLGSKHPAAIANLKNYLQLEAQDKKGLDPANTTPPEGKSALVPAQPNFCDCGVYLIHFVQTFMKDPSRATELILRKKPKEYPSREREADWDAAGIASLRDTLLSQTQSLAELWRAEKAAKEAQRQREAAEAGASAPASEAGGGGAPESDDEIIVGEVISRAKAARAKGKGKAKAEKDEEGETKADRLR